MERRRQLEKIDMLDHADLVAINKFDRRGGEDALRDVRRQMRRNLGASKDVPDSALPVFGTIASQFGDRGVTALFLALVERFAEKLQRPLRSRLELPEGVVTGERHPLIPEARVRYLGEIAEAARSRRAWVEEQVSLARRLFQLDGAKRECQDDRVKQAISARFGRASDQLGSRVLAAGAGLGDAPPSLPGRIVRFRGPRSAGRSVDDGRDALRVTRSQSRYASLRRLGRNPEVPARGESSGPLSLYRRSLSVQARHRVAPPAIRWGGRTGANQPTISFSVPERRSKAFCLPPSTASRSMARTPTSAPTSSGRFGEGGVSVATLDDMKKLYKGFELTDPLTSVSMTINGPGPEHSCHVLQCRNRARGRQVQQSARPAARHRGARAYQE